MIETLNSKEFTLRNLKETLNATFLLPEHQKKIFSLYLSYLKSYHAGQKKDLGTIDNLSKLVVILIQIENMLNSQPNNLLQTVIDHFDDLIDLLSPSPSNSQLKETHYEKRRFGHHRIHILRLLTNCIAIGNKKFSIKVSVSEFGETVAKLFEVFPSNDRLAVEGLRLYKSILNTNQRVLVETVCKLEIITRVLNSLLKPKNANKLTILKFLRTFDIGADKKMKGVKDRKQKEIKDVLKSIESKINSPSQIAESMTPSTNLSTQNNLLSATQSQVISMTGEKLANSWATQGYLRSISQNPKFKDLTLNIYSSCENEIKIYLNLEEELTSDSGFRKNTESSVYSNTLIDELEAYGSADSGDQSGTKDMKVRRVSDASSGDVEDSPIKDFGETYNPNSDDYENNFSYPQIRRRKISEDNIRVDRIDRKRTGSLKMKVRKKM